MKTSALSTALGLFPSAIKSGEAWSGRCQSVLEEAGAELIAIRRALTPQPLAEAPTDGTPVLIMTPYGAVEAKWDADAQEWMVGWLGVTLRPTDALGWTPAPPRTEQVDPAKPGSIYEDVAKALRHSVNFNSIDAKLDMSDIAITEVLMPEVIRHLRGETDVQVYEAMTPQERAEAFSPETLGG